MRFAHRGAIIQIAPGKCNRLGSAATETHKQADRIARVRSEEDSSLGLIAATPPFPLFFDRRLYNLAVVGHGAPLLDVRESL